MLLSPRPEWLATLPNTKLPDCNDFKAWGDDMAGEFAQAVNSGRPIEAEPLA